MPKARHIKPLPGVMTAIDCQQYLNMSRDFFYAEIDAGRLKAIKRGRLTMIARTCADDYLLLVQAESYDVNGRFKKDPTITAAIAARRRQRRRRRS